MQNMHDIFYPVAHRSQEEIDALKFRYETFDAAVIPEIFRSSLGYSVISWEKPASWSTSHVIYFVTVKEQKESLVLRANIGWGEPEYYLDIEKLITDKVAALGVPVNCILHVDTSRKHFPFDFQIQEKLIGMDIEDHFHGSQADYDVMSFDLGKYVAMWGELTFDGFGRFTPSRTLLVGSKKSMYDYVIVQLDNDLKFLADGGVVSVSQADQIRKIFEEYKEVMNIKRGTFVQYDLADHNMMFDGKRTITGILDWEAAVVGDSMLDLASAPTWKTYFPRKEKMIEGYRSIRDLPEYFEEKMNIYTLRTMIWKMVYALRAGILNNDRKNKFDAALIPFGLCLI